MGQIFNIQRCSVHDGPGIRTTVFLKGCSLSCAWCHNPESRRSAPELAYYYVKCVFCGKCREVCPHGCHIVTGYDHNLERKNCISCGRCICTCPESALEIIGKEMAAKDVIIEAVKDKKFYKNSIGGLTLSGGEPLYQSEFSFDILKMAKENELHTCVETSGYADFKKFEEIMLYTDIFLYDWKETDEELFNQATGVSNKIVHENLLRLDKAGVKTILRCPLVPGYNNRRDHYIGIAELANQLHNIIEINIMPFHNLGNSKYENIGLKCLVAGLSPLTDETKNECVEIIIGKTNVPVRLQ